MYRPGCCEGKFLFQLTLEFNELTTTFYVAGLRGANQEPSSFPIDKCCCEKMKSVDFSFGSFVNGVF